MPDGPKIVSLATALAAIATPTVAPHSVAEAEPNEVQVPTRQSVRVARPAATAQGSSHQDDHDSVAG